MFYLIPYSKWYYILCLIMDHLSSYCIDIEYYTDGRYSTQQTRFRYEGMFLHKILVFSFVLHFLVVWLINMFSISISDRNQIKRRGWDRIYIRILYFFHFRFFSFLFCPKTTISSCFFVHFYCILIREGECSGCFIPTKVFLHLRGIFNRRSYSIRACSKHQRLSSMECCLLRL